MFRHAVRTLLHRDAWLRIVFTHFLPELQSQLSVKHVVSGRRSHCQLRDFVPAYTSTRDTR